MLAGETQYLRENLENPQKQYTAMMQVQTQPAPHTVYTAQAPPAYMPRYVPAPPPNRGYTPKSVSGRGRYIQ